MHCLVESKKIVIVGIPGVGKTTLVSKMVELLNLKKTTVSVYSFGTIMLEAARKNNTHDRDAIRKLPINDQKKLQLLAANQIANFNDKVVIIDTHAFISTKSGFYPGLPEYVLKIIKPANFISVSARPEEIYNRRMNDKTRNRILTSIDTIKKELAVQEAMLSSCSVLSGSPIIQILNKEGKVTASAEYIIKAIGL